jgi:hypothetical protein
MYFLDFQPKIRVHFTGLHSKCIVFIKTYFVLKSQKVAILISERVKMNEN